MALTAELKIPNESGALNSFSECETLRNLIRSTTAEEGFVHIDVFDLLLLRDMHGDVHDQAERDRLVWAAAGTPLLTESDISLPEVVDHVGEWNISFLRWLKFIASATEEDISIEYA